MRVGTLPWLLHYEWRLRCRDPLRQQNFQAGFFVFAIALTLSLGWIGLAPLIEPFNANLQAFQNYFAQDVDRTFWIAIAGLSVFIFGCFLESFSRPFFNPEHPASLNLMVSSPLSPQVLFAGRYCMLLYDSLYIYGFALTFAMSLTLLLQSLQPIIGMAIVGLQLLLLCNSLAMGVGSVLVRWPGTQRIRWIMNACVGLVMLAVLIFLMTANSWGPLFVLEPEFVQQLWQHHVNDNFWWGRESWLWLPAQALYLDLQAILLMTLLTVGCVWLTCRFAPKHFVAALQQSQHQTSKSVSSQHPKPFVSGVVHNIVLKEWRILRWKSRLLSRWLLIAFMFFPIAVAGFDPHGLEQLDPATLVMASTATIGAIMSSVVTACCMAQEQAIGWLASVPASPATLRKGKLLASLSMVWVALMPVVVLVSWLGGSVWMALILILMVSTSQVTLRYWNTVPISGQILAVGNNKVQRTYRDELLMNLELTSMCLWGACGWLLTLSGWQYGILALCLELSIIVLAYRRSRKLGPPALPY